MDVKRESSIRRGIQVLLALASDEALERGGLGVSQVGQLLGREKSQISRTLQILAEFGLVDRDPESLAYRLGWRIYSLAQLAGEQRLLDAARPLVRNLVDTLGERIYLSVLQGRNVLTVISESPSHAVQAVGWVGRTVPAYCTSSGRALLFDHGRRDLERLFEGVTLDRLAPNTVRNVGELFARIESARESGYAVADEEFERGLVAIAVPVRDPATRIVAALNVSAPKFRFAERLQEAGEALLAASGVISARLQALPEGSLDRQELA